MPQGEALQLDVDGDSFVTPLDVLIIINELNRAEARSQFAATQLARFSDESMPADSAVDSGNSADSSNSDMDWSKAATDIAFADTDFDDTSFADFVPNAMQASRLAGYKVLTAVNANGVPMVISVDESGNVSAISDAEKREVNVDEDSSIRIDGERTGLSLVNLGGDFVLAPVSASPSDFTFSWPLL
jgi:hypothetical protein